MMTLVFSVFLLTHQWCHVCSNTLPRQGAKYLNGPNNGQTVHFDLQVLIFFSVFFFSATYSIPSQLPVRRRNLGPIRRKPASEK